MEQMNENQLLSWRPRRPSAAFRRRMLGRGDRDELRNARWLWSGLAPAMVCVWLTFLAFNHENAELGVKTPMSLLLSNQDTAAFANGPGQAGQNHLAAVSFYSTNRSELGSSIPFTRMVNWTN